jgi:hypothetical protein
LFPKKGESFFIFEATSIYLFAMSKEIGPAVRGWWGIREGKINEVPELKGEVTFQKEVGDGF